MARALHAPYSLVWPARFKPLGCGYNIMYPFLHVRAANTGDPRYTDIIPRSTGLRLIHGLDKNRTLG
jgi:hypothetical protein